MRLSQRGAILGSLIGILVCGGIGGFAAWFAVNALGIEGTFGAIVAAAIGMIVATSLWAGATTLLRALGWIR